jgi:hypothetical protein
MSAHYGTGVAAHYGTGVAAHYGTGVALFDIWTNDWDDFLCYQSLVYSPYVLASVLKVTRIRCNIRY